MIASVQEPKLTGRVTTESKQQQYDNLVEQRKACGLCRELVNPSRCAGGMFDSNEIGPWSRWQGDLNARVVIVGRDWGTLDIFVRQRGREHQADRDSDGPTNAVLCELLKEAGLHADLPSRGEVKYGGLFFSNAVLCLKQGDIHDKPPHEYFENCQRFLRRQIEIIQPKVVIGLGQIQYRAVLNAFGSEPIRGPHRNAVEGPPVQLPGGPFAIAVYDCCPQSINRNRNLVEQCEDWRRIRSFLQSLS